MQACHLPMQGCIHLAMFYPGRKLIYRFSKHLLPETKSSIIPERYGEVHISAAVPVEPLIIFLSRITAHPIPVPNVNPTTFLLSAAAPKILSAYIRQLASLLTGKRELRKIPELFCAEGRNAYSATADIQESFPP